MMKEPFHDSLERPPVTRGQQPAKVEHLSSTLRASDVQAHGGVDAGGVEKVEMGSEARPLVSAPDLKFLARACVLGPAAALAPPRAWPAICMSMARLPGRSRLSVDTVEEALAGAIPHVDAHQRRQIALQAAANRDQSVMQSLRGVLGRPPVDVIEVEGAGRLEAALAMGRGAVLWVGYFIFASNIAKMGLAQAGHAPWQVTMVGHGVSTSALGVNRLNRAITTLEDRYLAGRIVYDPANPGALPRTVMRKLSEGGVVAISAGGSLGNTVLRMPFLGGRIALRFGASRLASLARAPLLPVFAVRVGMPARFRVVIEEPLEHDADPTRVAREFMERNEPWVLRYPDQWFGWNQLQAS